MLVSAVRGVVRGHRPPLSSIQEETVFGIEGYLSETMGELLAGVTLLISWVFVQVAFAL
jgi:hypothetical protein